ncbi:MAG: PD-(D/E)XK nuclease family protein [Planctomycetota bacterium]|jgi:hypothetical protein
MAELPFPEDPAPQAPASAGPHLLLAPDAFALEGWLHGELNEHRERLRADPAGLREAGLRIVVPDGRYRSQLLARLGAEAWVGVEVLPLDAVAHRRLERAGAAPVAEARLFFEHTVRRTAAQLPGLAGVLGDLTDGFDAVIPAVDDLVQAGIEREAADDWAQEQFQAFLERRDLPPDEERAGEWFAETAEGRAAELARLAGVWRELAEANDLDRSVRLRRAAACDEPAGMRTLIVGFLRPSALELDLIEALVQGPDDAIALPATAEPEAWQGRVPRAQRRLLEHRAEPDRWALRLGGPAEERDALVDFLRAELDAGAPPEQLALIVDPESASAWARQLERHGIPCSGPGLPGALEPHGRWALAVVHLINHGSRATLARLFDALHSAALDTGADRARQAQTRAQLERRGFARLEDLDARRVDPERDPELAAALDALLEVRGALEALRAPEHDLGERVSRTLELLDGLGWPREESQRAYLAGVLDRLRTDPGADAELSAREFAQLLESAVERSARAPLGGQGAGVQLLRPTEALGLTWRALAWPGLVRGAWPRDTADDALLPDRLRGGGLWAGLRTAREDRALAREVFDQLLGSARRVWLTCAEFDADGKEQAPAPLWARARRTGRHASDAPRGPRPPEWHAQRAAGAEGATRRALLALSLDADAAHARTAALDELDAAPGRAADQGLGPYLGLAGAAPIGEDGVLFITRLESYARCGWQALLSRECKLEESLDPLAAALQLLPSALGLVVHEVLERSAREAGGERLPLPSRQAGSDPVDFAELLQADPVEWPRPSLAQLEPLLSSAARKVARDERLPGRFAAELLAERARPMLEESLEVLWPAGAPRRVLGVELAGRYPLEGFRGLNELRFYADLVELDPESDGPRLHLVDYKTGSPISSAKGAGTRAKHLAGKLESGQGLQAALYALASGGRGSYAYLKDGLELPADARFQGLDAEAARAPFDEVITALLGERQVGVYPPRLLDDGETRENRSCANCEVSLACRRQDSGARLRIEAWLESARSAPPEDPGHACWLGHWNRGSKEHLRGGEA